MNKHKTTHNAVTFARSAILTIAAIKDAIEAFDRGESNAFDVLDAIVVALEAREAPAVGAISRSRARRNAA